MDNLNALLTQIEAARLWNYFHKDWLLPIRLAVRQRLPAEYRVFVESEAVLITPDAWDQPGSPILPDISLSRAPSAPAAAASHREAVPASTAVVEADEPCDVETHYSLVIRRAPENHVVAAAELISPSNKGLGNRLDQQQHLRKRSEYFDAGVNLLELDALTAGARVLPDSLTRLSGYDRAAWTAFHDAGRRRYRGWGWNQNDPLPEIDWPIDTAQTVRIDLAATLREAAEFNRWEELVTAAD